MYIYRRRSFVIDVKEDYFVHDAWRQDANVSAYYDTAVLKSRSKTLLRILTATVMSEVTFRGRKIGLSTRREVEFSGRIGKIRQSIDRYTIVTATTQKQTVKCQTEKLILQVGSIKTL